MKAPNFEVVPVARATAPSSMSKEPATTLTMPAQNQDSRPARTAATMAMPKPMRVSMFGVRPILARPAA